MTCFPSRLFAAGGLLLLAAAIGCDRITAIRPSDRPSDRPAETSQAALPADPDEPAVKRVVEQALAARIKGDAAALAKLCDASLAAKVAAIQPRPLEFEIRRVDVLSRTATVQVWTRDHALDARDNQSLVTYRLTRAKEGWRIADASSATFTETLTTKQMETKP